MFDTVLLLLLRCCTEKYIQNYIQLIRMSISTMSQSTPVKYFSDDKLYLALFFYVYRINSFMTEVLMIWKPVH